MQIVLCTEPYVVTDVSCVKCWAARHQTPLQAMHNVSDTTGSKQTRPTKYTRLDTLRLRYQTHYTRKVARYLGTFRYDRNHGLIQQFHTVIHLLITTEHNRTYTEPQTHNLYTERHTTEYSITIKSTTAEYTC